MKLVELAALYALIGVGGAIFAVTRVGAASARSVDAVLMFTLWPLYGPFLLTREHVPHLEPARGEVACSGFGSSAASALSIADPTVSRISS